MRLLRVTLLVGILTLFSACASQRGPVPVEERSTPPAIGSTQHTQAVEVLVNEFPHESNSERADNHPAVIALLNESQRNLRDGNSESAIAALERGVRLKPKNALLWHRLAAIYLQKKNWQRVIPLAQKSLSLAASDAQLQLANWRMIEVASRAIGDNSGARKAQKEVRKLQ